MPARARVSLISWEEDKSAVLFMISFSNEGVRSMAQVLRLPFEYFYHYLYSFSFYIPKIT